MRLEGNSPKDSFDVRSAVLWVFARSLIQLFTGLVTVRNGTLDAGWLDAGIEYNYPTCDVFGRATASGAAGLGYGVTNRFMVAAILRF
jgi:hypothetical protein